jgi:hypothetical protein
MSFAGLAAGRNNATQNLGSEAGPRGVMKGCLTREGKDFRDRRAGFKYPRNQGVEDKNHLFFIAPRVEI